MKDFRHQRLTTLADCWQTLRSATLAIIFALIGQLLGGCSNLQDGAGPAATPPAKQVDESLSAGDLEKYARAQGLIEEQPVEALGILSELSQEYPYNAAVWTNLAVAHLLAEKIEEAGAAAERALALDSSNAVAHNVSGLVAMENHAFEQAKEYFLRATELDGGYALAYYNLALLYDVYLQNIAQALQYYERYLVLQPGDTRTRAWADQLKFSLEER